MRRANNILVNCAQGAVALTSPAINLNLSFDRFQSWWNACRRLRKYSLYGCTLTGVGLVLMYVMVSRLGMNVFLAQAIVVPAIMTVVSYFVHRCRTFGDREVCKQSGGRFTAVRLGGMGVSKISFFVLVGVFGVQYLVASVLIIAGLAWPTYRLNRDWAFKEDQAPVVYRGLQGTTPPSLR